MTHAPICVLHIGKTGGSFLRSVLRFNERRWQRDLQLLRHDANLQNTREAFGDARELAFVIRDPLERFSSAFYSRMRQGRPTYNSPWSVQEAVAFRWFDSAEALALALSSEDDRLRSAADFAMGSIQHLAKDHRWYLGGASELLAEADRIAVCIDLARLTARLPEVLARLGLEDFEMPNSPRFHAAPEPLPTLSAEAEENLRTYWADEFELYEVAKSLSKF